MLLSKKIIHTMPKIRRKSYKHYVFVTSAHDEDTSYGLEFSSKRLAMQFKKAASQASNTVLVEYAAKELPLKDGDWELQ